MNIVPEMPIESSRKISYYGCRIKIPPLDGIQDPPIFNCAEFDSKTSSSEGRRFSANKHVFLLLCTTLIFKLTISSEGGLKHSPAMGNQITKSLSVLLFGALAFRMEN